MAKTTRAPPSAVDTRPVLSSPCRARTPTEITGRMNLNDMFTIPVSSVDSAMSAGVKPHELYMA